MTVKRLCLTLLAFFLIFSSKAQAAVGTIPLDSSSNPVMQVIPGDNNLSTTNSFSYGGGTNHCGLNAFQYLSFESSVLDISKSYLIEIDMLNTADSESTMNVNQPAWRPNPNSAGIDSAFDTQTLAFSNSNVAPSQHNFSFNSQIFLQVTPSGNSSTRPIVSLGIYLFSADNNLFLLNFPAYQNCSLPNNSYTQYKVTSISYLEIDQSVTTSIPLLLNQLIQTTQDASSSGGGSGSSVNLQTIENLLTSINTKITDLPTFISTVELDLSSILTGLQTGNTSAADAASRLSTIIGILQTISGNQISSSDFANLATSSDISSQTSAITTLLNTIISNQGSSGGGSSVSLTTIENYLSSIDSTLSSMSSDVSATATNIYGIAQNANTQTGYQYDIANNTDYLPLIYNYLTGSSGGGSTGAYDQDIASNTQSAADNTSNINITLNNSTYDTQNDTDLQTAYGQMESDYQFDQIFGISSQRLGADWGLTTGGLKNVYNFIVDGLFGGVTNYSEAEWAYFLGNVQTAPTPEINNYNNSGATKLNGTQVSGFSLMPYKCKPLHIPLPQFVISWLRPSSLNGIQSPSTATTNFVSQKPSYAFGPFGSGPGFLLPCFYDIFPDFFNSGWGHYWMVVSCFFILGWMFIDFFDFLSGCLTLQNANTLKKVKKMF